MRKEAKAAALAKELERRSYVQPKLDLEPLMFPQQSAFVNDPAKLKAALCTRRAAKSYSSGLYLIREASDNPGVSVVYLALTRDSAKKIMWKDVLKVLNRRLALRARFNETDLTMTLPNGSVIYLGGADATDDEMSKLLGQKFKLAVIDESASFTINLHDLVYKTLKPAMADYRGTICMVGTPSNVKRGLFYDITTGSEPGWSVHQWTWADNPHVAPQMREEIAELLAANPAVEDTAWFQQMYFSKWDVEEDAKVYRATRARNVAQQLPRGVFRWEYILGMDLGYNDDTAWVVWAYSDRSPVLYCVEAYKEAKLDLTAVAEITRRLDAKYGFSVKIVDGASKQAVQELNNRHGLALITADKTGKSDFIQIMNDEYVQSKIMLLPAAEPLVAEMEELVWYVRETKVSGRIRIEDPKLPNHACDAALYGWRYTYTYIQSKEARKPKETDDDYEQWQEDQHVERIRQNQQDASGFASKHW